MKIQCPTCSLSPLGLQTPPVVKFGSFYRSSDRNQFSATFVSRVSFIFRWQHCSVAIARRSAKPVSVSLAVEYKSRLGFVFRFFYLRTNLHIFKGTKANLKNEISLGWLKEKPLSAAATDFRKFVLAKLV